MSISTTTDTTSARSEAGSATAPLGAVRRRYGVRAAWIMVASGWSANQFSALLGAYRSELGLVESAVTGLFALYVVGLIPGLLVGGPLADRVGRRPVALAALALNLLSTGVLMLGAGATGWLWPGRFVTGVSAGALLAAGSAWIKELSSREGASATTASRRAGLFVSAGFASGGLVAALIARWAPEPMVVAYVPHVLLAAGAGLAALKAPESMAAPAVGRRSARRVGSPLLERSRELGEGWAQPTMPSTDQRGIATRFRRAVLPVAPWVFAAPSIGFVTLPGLVHGGLVHAGVATAVVPGTGLLVQPLARRLAPRHRLATAVAGLLIIAAGFTAAAFAAATGGQALALAAAAVLGAGYGFVLTHGLTEITAMAPPHRLARLTAYFWTAAYAGMFAPYAVTLLSSTAHPATLLAAAAALAALSCALLLALDRRPAAAASPVSPNGRP
ncbi:MFS transporter [Streptomyces sp. NPDC041068]|uniref:MFS transporter n=1 Tax=Streptomyces sp. NPDC041068 TaxID=3155130 RepID=UPI0033CDED20